MDFSSVFILAGLILLAFVCALRSTENGRTRAVLAGFVAGMVLATAAVRWASEQAGYYPSTNALRLVAGVERELHAAIADPQVQRILVFEGSSYSARGLDARQVASRMSESTGIGTAAVQLSLDGSNHFERYWMLSIAIERLDERQREALRRKQVVLLMEMQNRYDLDPLNNFTRNERTYRAYAYMTLGNALAALRAVAIGGGLDGARTVAVLEHAAVNLSNLGGFRRVVSLDGIRIRPGYMPLDVTKRGYRYRGMDRVRAALRHADAWRATGRGFAAADRRLDWIGPVRVARYRDLLGDLVDLAGFYAVASADADDVYHVAAFCAKWPADFCLDYEDPALIDALDGREYWNDARHMRRAGADRFAPWFADRLAAALAGEAGR